MKKILSVVISISMVLCMGITSLAEEPEMDSGVIQSLTGAIANEGEFAYYILKVE